MIDMETGSLLTIKSTVSLNTNENNGKADFIINTAEKIRSVIDLLYTPSLEIVEAEVSFSLKVREEKKKESMEEFLINYALGKND